MSPSSAGARGASAAAKSAQKANKGKSNSNASVLKNFGQDSDSLVLKVLLGIGALTVELLDPFLAGIPLVGTAFTILGGIYAYKRFSTWKDRSWFFAFAGFDLVPGLNYLPFTFIGTCITLYKTVKPRPAKSQDGDEEDEPEEAHSLRIIQGRNMNLESYSRDYIGGRAVLQPAFSTVGVSGETGVDYEAYPQSFVGDEEGGVSGTAPGYVSQEIPGRPFSWEEEVMPPEVEFPGMAGEIPTAGSESAHFSESDRLPFAPVSVSGKELFEAPELDKIAKERPLGRKAPSMSEAEETAQLTQEEQGLEKSRQLIPSREVVSPEELLPKESSGRTMTIKEEADIASGAFEGNLSPEAIRKMMEEENERRKALLDMLANKGVHLAGDTSWKELVEILDAIGAEDLYNLLGEPTWKTGQPAGALGSLEEEEEEKGPAPAEETKPKPEELEEEFPTELPLEEQSSEEQSGEPIEKATPPATSQPASAEATKESSQSITWELAQKRKEQKEAEQQEKLQEAVSKGAPAPQLTSASEEPGEEVLQNLEKEFFAGDTIIHAPQIPQEESLDDKGASSILKFPGNKKESPKRADSSQDTTVEASDDEGEINLKKAA